MRGHSNNDPQSISQGNATTAAEGDATPILLLDQVHDLDSEFEPTALLELMRNVQDRLGNERSLYDGTY